MKIQEQVSLKDKNWFGTGGAARYFCEPATAQDFKDALIFAKKHKLEIFVLGEGANIVVSDDGFDGLVICPQTTNPIINEKTGLVTASAGIHMNDLIEKTVAHNLTGLEIFSDIPGTIGGSVYINLHYFEALISKFLINGEIINIKTGEVKTVDNKWFEFGYDNSKLMEKKYYLVNATLQLKPSTDIETAFAKGRRFEIIRHRRSRYPKGKTCGSFFRNFHDHEVSFIYEGKKMPFIAYYLDKIGVKGTEKVGDVQVSSQHANMLVNNGQGTSSDIVTLARVLQEKVKKQFGIVPKPECIFVGFKEYPLLTPQS
ncbi:MAG: UDP-N-acetylmuramate dehydrogenase [Alteromonas naphthalenivorans]|jgi:UDP-N-acetylmuramate dehydrogenase